MHKNSFISHTRGLFRGAILSMVVLGIIALHHPLVFADSLTPQAILQRADAARGNVGGIVWEIEITSIEKNRQQHRRIRVTAKNYDSLAEFLEPAKVKGQKILMRDRNMWFVKPGLRKPVPLSPRQKLLGMASNGDIASTNYAGDYTVEQMTTDYVDGRDCYRFELKAITKKVTYDRIRYWISKQRMVGIKADFFTVSGKLFKSADFEYDHRIAVDGHSTPFISKMTITNTLMEDHITTMTYADPKTGAISDAVFNLNLLVR